MRRSLLRYGELEGPLFSLRIADAADSVGLGMAAVSGAAKPILLCADGKPQLPEGYAPTAEHRAHHIPPGWIEISGRIPCHWVRVGSTHRLAIGDVERKIDDLMGERHWREGYNISPPPKGFWEIEEDGRLNFVISNGCHRYAAGWLFGDRAHQVVRWNSPDPLHLEAP